MPTTQAQKDVEAKRYRLQVMLHTIAGVARKRKQGDVVRRADALQNEVRAVPALKDGEDAQAVLGRLDALTPRVAALGQEVGVRFDQRRHWPKWLRLALWVSPGVVVLALVMVIVERRRRLKALTEDEVRSLEDTAPTTARSMRAR